MTAMRARTTSVWTLPRERQAMRNKLLEIARGLIAQHGEDALTFGAIANEADIAHATVYGYFSSKREMLAALASLPEPPRASDPMPTAATMGAAATHAEAEGPSSAATTDHSTDVPDAVPEAPIAHASPDAAAPMRSAIGNPEDTVPWNDDAVELPHGPTRHDAAPIEESVAAPADQAALPRAVEDDTAATPADGGSAEMRAIAEAPLAEEAPTMSDDVNLEPHRRSPPARLSPS